MHARLTLPEWVVAVALVFGLAGLACLIWGFLSNRKYAVWIGHFVVSCHMLMYLLGSGGNWVIGIATASFAVAGFVYPGTDSKYRYWLWVALSLPPGLAYAASMGLFVLFLVSGGM